MVKLTRLVCVFGLCILAGCQHTSVSTRVQLDPPPVRGITWKSVTIKREAPDRYVMDSKSRNNLKDNLADTERYVEQTGNVIKFYKGQPNVKSE